MNKQSSCFGFCERCGETHSLPFGRSIDYAQEVMDAFRLEKRLDYEFEPSQADPGLDFDVILPGNRGHMFGVMECLDAAGATIWLRAFSSLGTGIRDAPGWVPYLLETSVFDEVVKPQQDEIKRLTMARNQLDLDNPVRAELELERKQISQGLMPIIHDLYFFRNFRGEILPLREIFRAEGGLPGGVGDCCAPKLLNHAAANGLRPVSVAEFYWGGKNKSGRKRPGQFFEACAEKCQPILGYMLCGLDD